MLGKDDKRGFHRMSVDAEVKLYVADGNTDPLSPPSGTPILGICTDLSATGVAIKTDEMFEMDAYVHLTLDASSPITPSLNALCRVVRCQSSEDNQYVVGLEFLKLS